MAETAPDFGTKSPSPAPAAPDFGTKSPAPPARVTCCAPGCVEPGTFRCKNCMGGLSYCGRGCFAEAWEAGHRKRCARLNFPALTSGKYEFHPRPSHDPSAAFLVEKYGFSMFLCEEEDEDDVDVHVVDVGSVSALEASEASVPVSSAGLRGGIEKEWLFIAPDKGLPPGSYKLSSSFFAQVLSKLHLGLDLDRFAAGSVGVWHSLTPTIMIGGSGCEFLNRACLVPRDPLYARLPHYTTHSRHWLYGPDKKKRYLGMGLEGPCRLTLEGWAKEAAQGLRVDAAMQSTEHARRTMYATAEALSARDAWVLYTDVPPPVPPKIGL